MSTYILRHSARRAAAILAGALLLTTLFASLGAGPDEPKASNVNSEWEIFKGHVYAESRAAPPGVELIACLGGCEIGYVTAPVTTGKDGIYQVKVEPGQLRPDGRMVTFWLTNGAQRVESNQDVLFQGLGETRVLDLNFENLPSAAASDAPGPAAEGEATSDDAASAESATGPGSEAGAGAESTTGPVTTDLMLPSADEMGLLPSDSPQAYISAVQYAGMPLLPGFLMVLGLLLAMAGVALLIYRRRLVWQ